MSKEVGNSPVAACQERKTEVKAEAAKFFLFCSNFRRQRPRQFNVMKI